MSTGAGAQDESSKVHSLDRLKRIEQYILHFEQRIARLEKILDSTAIKTGGIGPAVNAKRYEILSVGSKLVERGDTLSQFAWKLLVKNNSRNAIKCDAIIQFVDKDGFAVREEAECDLELAPLKVSNFTGCTYINTPLISSIVGAQAKLSLNDD